MITIMNHMRWKMNTLIILWMLKNLICLPCTCMHQQGLCDQCWCPFIYFTSLVGQTLYRATPLETNTSLLQHFSAESSRELMSLEEYRSALLRKLNNKQRQVVMFILLFNFLSQLPFVSFSSLSLTSLCSLSQSSLFSLSSFPLASPLS